jgi:putative lipoic acid-binding regulatory protein
MSVTVTFIATSRDQLDAIYRELGLEESIIMVL